MVTFIVDGQFDVGYEINKITKFKMRIQGNNQIGGFECSYNRRSQVIYKISSNSDGFFIRKKNWNEISKLYPEYFARMRRNCLFFYVKKIRRNINNQKTRDIEKFVKRSDFKKTLVLDDDFSNDIKEICHQEFNQVVDTE
jgi:hypothetical protein